LRRHSRCGDSIVAGQNDNLDAVILQHLEGSRSLITCRLRLRPWCGWPRHDRTTPVGSLCPALSTQ
jgi:hypothetical protein